jgi:hypothetical protein
LLVEGAKIKLLELLFVPVETVALRWPETFKLDDDLARPCLPTAVDDDNDEDDADNDPDDDDDDAEDDEASCAFIETHPAVANELPPPKLVSKSYKQG